jgi:N-acetyl-anhydromuramyl-L-alanine amidase AmpD
VRDRAANVAAQIASSAESPPEVKQAAADVIAKIKRVTGDEVVQMIYSQPLTRKITDVILHHATLLASSYKGAQTIFGIADLQLGNVGHVSWHYAIAADGSIWLGVPLNEKAMNSPRHNETSVSVMLLMDGNKELPTDAQRSSLIVVLNALFARLKLNATANSPDGSGFHFHRDYGKTTCPGSLLTKEMVLAWR